MYNRDNSSHKLGGVLSIESRLSTHHMGTQCCMNGFGSSTAVATREEMLLYIRTAVKVSTHSYDGAP